MALLFTLHFTCILTNVLLLCVQEDLWLSAFPVGTEWENIDKIKEFNWSFENVEEALEEGGELHGKTLYMFGSTEPQLLYVNGESKIVLIPIVVAVDCPFPPSDKIGINSVQRENEEIVPMKAMKMAWVPYVPLEDRYFCIIMLNDICYLLFSLYLCVPFLLSHCNFFFSNFGFALSLG
ncbi:ATP/GTP binding protein-like [Zea mays]|uniref:ATP/GTP binding protein-like n=1 Tax=Zea mays TaxID=4577 RepID=A0A1D6J958_MAIZE|nr:ATP/GTP binding protein-like [Zea mays]